MGAARGSDIIPSEYFHIKMFALGRYKLAVKAVWGAGFYKNPRWAGKQFVVGQLTRTSNNLAHTLTLRVLCVMGSTQGKTLCLTLTQQKP